MDEFRKTRRGDRLPKISAFQGDTHAQKYKRQLTHYGNPPVMKTYNTREVSKEPNILNVVPNINHSEPEFKLPAVSKGDSQIIPSSRGNLKVRLTYHSKDGLSSQQRKGSPSNIDLTKHTTKFRLEKKWYCTDFNGFYCSMWTLYCNFRNVCTISTIIYKHLFLKEALLYQNYNKVMHVKMSFFCFLVR